jgi:hypothetical protein
MLIYPEWLCIECYLQAHNILLQRVDDVTRASRINEDSWV